MLSVNHYMTQSYSFPISPPYHLKRLLAENLCTICNDFGTRAITWSMHSALIISYHYFSCHSKFLHQCSCHTLCFWLLTKHYLGSPPVLKKYHLEYQKLCQPLFFSLCWYDQTASNILFLSWLVPAPPHTIPDSW